MDQLRVYSVSQVVWGPAKEPEEVEASAEEGSSGPEARYEPSPYHYPGLEQEQEHSQPSASPIPTPRFQEDSSVVDLWALKLRWPRHHHQVSIRTARQ